MARSSPIILFGVVGARLIEPEKLAILTRGDPAELNIHLALLENALGIQGTEAKAYCYCLPVDANGRVRVTRLAEFLRGCVVEYTIPRKRIEEAKARDEKYGQSSSLLELYEIAKRTFTHLKNSGEGGELLVFLFAERFLKLPQVLCKMDLKTAGGVHFHGCDGVYAETEGDKLVLYWGESKIYADPASAVRDCLASLAPFLVEKDGEDAERERDLFHLSDKANLSDPNLLDAFKEYFKRSSPKSNQVEYRGIALAGFNFDKYPPEDGKGIASEIEAAVRSEMAKWLSNVSGRLDTEKLTKFHIHIFLLPLPSVDTFRSEFLHALGLE